VDLGLWIVDFVARNEAIQFPFFERIFCPQSPLEKNYQLAIEQKRGQAKKYTKNGVRHSQEAKHNKPALQ